MQPVDAAPNFPSLEPHGASHYVRSMPPNTPCARVLTIEVIQRGGITQAAVKTAEADRGDVWRVDYLRSDTTKPTAPVESRWRFICWTHRSGGRVQPYFLTLRLRDDAPTLAGGQFPR